MGKVGCNDGMRKGQWKDWVGTRYIEASGKPEESNRLRW